VPRSEKNKGGCVITLKKKRSGNQSTKKTRKDREEGGLKSSAPRTKKKKFDASSLREKKGRVRWETLRGKGEP